MPLGRHYSSGFSRVSLELLCSHCAGLNKRLMEELESSSIGHSIFPTRARPPPTPTRDTHTDASGAVSESSTPAMTLVVVVSYHVIDARLRLLPPFIGRECASCGLKTTS